MYRMILAAAGALLFTGWVATIEHVTHKHQPTESWDQEHLKQNDHGCPTAIFVAPGGDLKQCELSDSEAAEPKDGPKYFPTADAAALWVSGKIYQTSHYYEYGGIIMKTPNGYGVTRPVTQHHGEDVHFDVDPESFDFPIVASYHVHPCLKNAFPSVFSPTDLAGSRVARTPGYVLDECTGDVHYWAPGDGYMSQDDMLKLGVHPFAFMAGVQLAVGKIIGKIVVDGAVLN